MSTDVVAGRNARVVTIRMKATSHSRLNEARHIARTSMNRFALEAIEFRTAAILAGQPDPVPEEFRYRDPADQPESQSEAAPAEAS